jgi:hypothetical protein
MSEDPRNIAARPSSDSPEDSKAIDQAMLLALSHRLRVRTPLSPDTERLLDRWVAGDLPCTDAERAAKLTQSNEFAAEHVLERRLVTLAEEGPAIPGALADRVMKASRMSQRRTHRRINLRWPAFDAWQFPFFGAAIAASLIFLMLSAPFWRQSPSKAQQIQIALVTVGDRSVLSPQIDNPRSVAAPTLPGVSDAIPFDAFGPTRNLRLRNNTEPPPTPLNSTTRPSMEPEWRIRDVDVPTDLLRLAIASANRDTNTTVTNPELIAMLVPRGINSQRGVRLLIDMAVVDALKESARNASLPVRLYDLEDDHTALILEKLSGISSIGHLMLLTVVP